MLTWKNGIGQYLDDPRVQNLAKRLCSVYAQKLYNPSAIEDKKPKNKVHFYVARDSDDALYLYLGKPVRRNGFWGTGNNSSVIGDDANFFLEKCGLKWEDFKSLKWEDEPVEVFLNMED